MSSRKPFKIDLLGGLPDFLCACLGTKAEYVSKGTVDIAEFLYEIIPDLSARSSLKRVKKLLKAGAPVNTEYQGLTALLVSVANGDPAIVQELLAAGAQAGGTQTHEHSLPLMVAAKLGSPKIVELLLDAGANPNQHNTQGLTPLHVAALIKRADACKLLLSHGADVNTKEYELSPLCLAVTIPDWKCWALRAAPPLALQVGKALIYKHCLYRHAAGLVFTC